MHRSIGAYALSIPPAIGAAGMSAVGIRPNPATKSAVAIPAWRRIAAYETTMKATLAAWQ